jgi:hypothetical protein
MEGEGAQWLVRPRPKMRITGWVSAFQPHVMYIVVCIGPRMTSHVWRARRDQRPSYGNLATIGAGLGRAGAGL